jgi:hypothetical protein
MKTISVPWLENSDFPVGMFDGRIFPATRPGKRLQVANWKMAHRNRGFTQLENGDFPVRYVKLPEGIDLHCSVIFRRLIFGLGAWALKTQKMRDKLPSGHLTD